MRLNDPLVTSFIYKDKEYDIDLSFDNVLDVFDIIGDTTISNHIKAEICLFMLLDQEISGVEAIELWNYVYTEFIEYKQEQIIDYDLNGNPMPVQENDEEERYLDLEQDAEYIYASFLHAYNIDLFKEQGKMHWIKFKSLLNGLPNDTIMQRIIQIRAWEPSDDKTSNYKENMKKLQKIYALKSDDEEVD